jgi:hypothetical protein
VESTQNRHLRAEKDSETRWSTVRLIAASVISTLLAVGILYAASRLAWSTPTQPTKIEVKP